jgi:glycosyltransferase involved in cell wall biosynthesis
VAGSGPLRSHLESLVRQEQIPDVEFLGLVEHMPPHYARAELLVVSSEAESCSNALLEAMAAAVCPVVSDVPGNLAVVEDRVSGRVVPLDEPETLARVMQELLADPAQRRELGNAARQRVHQQHGLEVTAQRYLKLFGSLVEQPSRCAVSAE